MLVTLLGYFHVFLAVNFDPFEALRQMSLPRFSQSWGRGQYGDAYALLFEVGALIYLIPPIAGLIYARSKEYKVLVKVVVAICALIYFLLRICVRHAKRVRYLRHNICRCLLSCKASNQFADRCYW